MPELELPVTMYQVTSTGRILKMDNAFDFSVAVSAAFEKCNLPNPDWVGLTPDQFEEHVNEIRRHVMERDAAGADPVADAGGHAPECGPG